jgi:hypothetical protein
MKSDRSISKVGARFLNSEPNDTCKNILKRHSCPNKHFTLSNKHDIFTFADGKKIKGKNDLTCYIVFSYPMNNVRNES